MQNALSIDVEEFFQVSGFEHVIDRRQWPEYPSRVLDSTRRLLHLLDGHDVRATFFVLGWVAEHCPRVVEEIAAAGHEIASHGYWHRLVYSQTREEFAEDVSRSLEAIDAACPGVNVLGYRAPSFSITSSSLWALDVLAELGLKYDSSVFPIGSHDRYGIAGASRVACRAHADLLEFPISTVRIGGRNWPVAGGGYFRLLPLWLTRRGIQRINAEGTPAMVYLHPWEVDPDQPRVRAARWKSKFRHYVNLDKTYDRLARLLEQFEFGPICEVYEAQLSKPVEATLLPGASLTDVSG